MMRPSSGFGEPELRVLCDIARRAGDEVMAVYTGKFAAWAKSDSSPLTDADLQSDAVIREALLRQFPGVFILSEESVSGERAGAETFFLVDPLDGTKEFVARNGEFTVNIALVQRGEPTAGVVLAPALGELFCAARGLGAWKGGDRTAGLLRVAPVPAGRPLRVLASRSHATPDLAGWLDRLPGRHVVARAGSSLKFCRIAEGRADLYPRIGPTSQWDTAAGQAVLEQAGGAVLGPDGKPMRYGLDRPILNSDFVAVANPGLQLPPLPATAG